MNIKCLIKSHNWDNDCQKCSRCGKKRNHNHDWSEDCEKCKNCLEVKLNVHDWSRDCQECSKCSKRRNHNHDWSEDCEKCKNCIKKRKNIHDWSIDCEECSKCGKTGKQDHDWSEDCTKCRYCEKKRNQNHDYSKNCESCGNCEQKRTGYHSWTIDCGSCSKCGSLRFNSHNWNNKIKKCTNCGKKLVKLKTIIPSNFKKGKIRNQIGKILSKAVPLSGPDLEIDLAIESIVNPKLLGRIEKRIWQKEFLVTNLFNLARAYQGEYSQNDEKLCEILNSFIDAKKEYGDFDLIYNKLAMILYSHGFKKHAFKCVNEGLIKSDRKFILFDKLAQLHWWESNILESVVYWTIASSLQHKTNNFIDHNPFINLTYIAKGLNLNEPAIDLLTQVDKINPMRFNHDFEMERNKVASLPDSDTISLIISQFWKKYYEGN